MGLRMSNGIPLNCFKQEMLNLKWPVNVHPRTGLRSSIFRTLSGSPNHSHIQRMICRFLLHSNVLGCRDVRRLLM